MSVEAVNYTSERPRPEPGTHVFATGTLWTFAPNDSMTDAEAEAFYTELEAEIEVGFGAVAERLRGKYGDRLAGITVQT